MSELPSDWKRVFERLEREGAAHAARADRLHLTLDRMADQMARQGDELRAITKMLRRRDSQLAKAEALNRKLRRALGWDEPEPEPDAAPVPEASVSAADTSTDLSPSRRTFG